MKLSPSELRYLIQEARARTPVGAFFKHRKSGAIYKVTGHLMWEGNQTVSTRYRPIEGPLAAQTNDELVEFARPTSEFFEVVEYTENNHPKIGSRFVRVVYEQGYMEKGV